jgi:hypothetical protein
MEREAEQQAANEELGGPPEEAQSAARADDASEEIPADVKEAAPGRTDPGDAQVSEGEAGSSSDDEPDSEPRTG